MSAPNPESPIGQTSRRYTEIISAGVAARFNRTVDWAEGLAPTYATRCRTGEFELFDKLGYPLSQVLHVEQEFEYLHPVAVGSELNYMSSVVQFLEKKGRKMIFLTLETLISVGDVPTLRSRTTVLIREVAP